MNVAAHEEKEKIERTGKRKEGEERKQADFKEAACYPSAVVQGAARRKNGLCGESARGNWPSGRPTAILTQPKQDWGPHHHVEEAIDWCSSILLALHVYTIHTTEISHFTIQKDRSQYVFGDGQKVRNDD